MTKDICGEPTKEDEPCQREAGWGTQREVGPCIDHEQERPVLRKFTPKVRERIIGAAPSGAFKKHIAEMAEIDPDTLDRWLAMGEEDERNGLDTDLATFYTDWQRARGMGAIQTLNNCSDEFIAERAYGYTKSQEVELGGSVDGGRTLAEEEQAAIRQALDPASDGNG